MAQSNAYGEHLKPLSEFSNYTIEQGDPDPRGYVVLSNDGTVIGEVEDLMVDTRAMKVEYLIVEPNDDSIARGDATGPLLLPAGDVDVRSESRQVIASQFAGPEAAYTRPAAYDRSSTTDRD